MGSMAGRGVRRPVVWSVILLLLILACAAWVGVRAYLAQQEIAASEQHAKAVHESMAKGDAAGARASASQLASHATAARGYMSDPLWQGASLLPLVGVNFSTASTLADVLADVATEAVVPLSEASATFTPASLKPEAGMLDLAALEAARPAVGRAAGVVQDARRRVAALEPGGGTVPQLRDAMDRLASLLGTASGQLSAVDTAGLVLPDMLGASGPRTYLVLFQNNAELRATGGIPGAVAELHASRGKLTLGRQAAAKDFPKFPEPVLPLAAQTQGLYGAITGQYFQDVNLAPQFPLSARLAAQMWKQHYGVDVDGVVSIDPVALSYLLKATGPVELASGERLSSDNAVQVLLSDSYAEYSGTAKDDYFASAAAAVFSKLSSGVFQPRAMVEALGQAARERRLLAWSPQAKEQDAIKAAGMDGWFPDQTPGRGVFAVYLNDATGGKMGYYLRESYTVGGAMCRDDGRPTWEVAVTLTNTAPPDAATSLPRYVTGAGNFGVSPGSVKTQVNVYAPPSGVFVGAWRGTEHLDVHRDMDSGYPVAQADSLLGPGQSSTLRFQFVGAPGTDTDPDLISTPTINAPVISNTPLSCENLVR
ncbi:hypothetical protein SCMU_28760 [Sinomonas cyclohexanicum]|uniref:DUF4012 domain-containing protein n=1 Tax=Sinomonas cyclohexanicum TaxID=322009 RepID=A0ABM7PYA2_SINCY|nr:DUF4012 domain-containing protein [Corynebacterium cyclohexanicum]BCT77034.1 hypothetical protein SCMU_28760 [Corynebacterium cyclohexanicum]